eukprot:jgi/Orpsp1_1/1181036/evm.model.c7180000075586.2
MSDKVNENINDKKRKHEALKLKFEKLKKKKLEIDKKIEKKENLKIKKKEKKKKLKIKKKEKKRKEKLEKLALKYNKINEEEEIQSQINDIISYIEPNKQLKDVDQGRLSEKSPMELKIEKAVSEGNFELAEKLNEELIIQQKEKILNEAIECKNYVDNKN